MPKYWQQSLKRGGGGLVGATIIKGCAITWEATWSAMRAMDWLPTCATICISES